MPLGQGIGELWEAVRDRVEVSGEGPTWQVTAGSFDSALAYARERFGDPVVLARADRSRLWARVTITVTTDRSLAAEAPPIEEVARPVVPKQRRRGGGTAEPVAEDGAEPLPSVLEEIFAHQEERGSAGPRIHRQGRHVDGRDTE